MPEGHCQASTPYARITNGTDNVHYPLDGSCKIPDGWWICSLSGTKFTHVDLYDYDTHEKIADFVSCGQLADRMEWPGFKSIMRTLTGDFTKPFNGRTNNHHYKRLYVRPTTVDLSRVTQ